MGMTVTINGTTGIAGVDGSAATPAVQGVDTNTGVFYGTDIVGISTGGTERMRVNASGNVGIGTTDNYRLAVVGGSIQLSGSTEAAAGLRIQSIGGVAHLSGINSDNNAFNPIALYTGNTESISMDTSGVVTGTAGNVMLIPASEVTLSNQTSVSFTDIPSWVRRITVIFKSVSGSGTSNFLVQVGTTTASGSGAGYFSVATGSGTTASSTSGFLATGLVTAATAQSGTLTLTHLGSNNWVSTSLLAWSNASSANYGGGNIAHATVVDMIRVTTANFTDTFDAGKINVLYE